MSYIGDFALGTTLYKKFTTVTTSGAPTQLAGTPVVSAYPNGSTTQITAGITLGVDHDGVTGFNLLTIVATSGNGYATATDYSLVITTGTVGGTSVVGYEVGSFSIENRSGLRPTTAGRTLDVSATGEAGLDWANVGSPTTSVTLSGTTVGTSTTVGATGINAIADQVWDEARSAHTTVGSFGEVSTTAQVADAVWDEARSGHTTTGTFGEGIASVQGDITGNLEGNVEGDVVGDVSVAEVQADGQTDMAEAVWNALRSSHTSAGSFGEYTNADMLRISTDATAADRLETMLDGTGGNTLSCVLGADAITATSIATDAITATKIAADAIGASELATGAAEEIADAVLTRNSSNWETIVTASAAAKKSLGWAVMQAVHKSEATNATTLTVYKADGSTAAGTRTISTDTTMAPIDSLDAPA